MWAPVSLYHQTTLLLVLRALKCGQMYVALSRVTSSQGLFLTAHYNPGAIKADKEAFQEYQRLKTESRLFSIPT